MNISVRKIKQMMDANLWTQGTLALKAGVSRTTINATLLKGSCSTGTAGKIAKALGVDPVILLRRRKR